MRVGALDQLSLRRPWTWRARAGPVALIAVAVLAAVSGLWMMVARNAPAGLPVTAEADGLSVGLHEAGWVSMDAHTMDSQGGFQMPAQMMPGAPAGDEMRLGIALTLVNTADRAREFNLGEEFVLAGGAMDTVVRLLGHLRAADPAGSGQCHRRRPLLRHDRAGRDRSGSRAALES